MWKMSLNIFEFTKTKIVKDFIIKQCFERFGLLHQPFVVIQIFVLYNFYFISLENHLRLFQLSLGWQELG
jgi:hypothetical protein